MKKLIFTIMICAISLLTACEKHDGIEYFKAKCVAELNGQSFIDQTPFAISPNIVVTPYVIYTDNELEFMTVLRVERTGPMAYNVVIHLLTNETTLLLSKEQIIEKTNSFDIPADDIFYSRKYIHYCLENKISYATVNGEIIDRGSFKITSYDKERQNYNGTFTLKFSEGAIKGEFDM